MTATGVRIGRLAGRLLHASCDPPGCGDWVGIAESGLAGEVRIVVVLPRRSVLRRLAAGRHDREQLIAANIDTVLVVGGLDGDHQPRRLRRYVILALGGGCRPVVVLNKSDLHPDPTRAVSGLVGLSPGVHVHAVSAQDPSTQAPVLGELRAGETVALLGSSGAGKSTLINALMGDLRQTTGLVRDHDSRGRHTTTVRELIPHLASGAVLLDTPGMRELALTEDADDLAAGFTDILAYTTACRFRDCRHASEPGCAVQAAVARGELAPDRVAEMHKLEHEQRREARRARHLAGKRLRRPEPTWSTYSGDES